MGISWALLKYIALLSLIRFLNITHYKIQTHLYSFLSWETLKLNMIFKISASAQLIVSFNPNECLKMSILFFSVQKPELCLIMFDDKSFKFII